MPSCPTCGKDFDSQKSVNKHHYPAHGTSIALNTAKCVKCDKEFEYYPSDKDGKYCSECVDNGWGNENLIHGAGEDNTNWRGGDIETSCSECGKDIVVRRANYFNHEHNFCDTECVSKYNSRMFTGEGNPRYIDGNHRQREYGKGWRSARGAALERDSYMCQRCGITKEELGQNPDVHHIKPVRTFESPPDAHFKENLVSLCRSCHMKVETRANATENVIRE